MKYPFLFWENVWNVNDSDGAENHSLIFINTNVIVVDLENHDTPSCYSSSTIYPVSAYPSEENEVRTMVDPNSKNDRKLQELMKVKLKWFHLLFALDIR